MPKKPVAKKKGGSKSGNPAKRAAENAGLAAGPAQPAAPVGTGFGLAKGAKGADASAGPSAEELATLQKFLGRS
jgi:signal recognition particle subunit SRP54